MTKYLEFEVGHSWENDKIKGSDFKIFLSFLY